MLNNERQQQILSCMEIKNTITVKELTDQLYASPSTIRRDLSELEAQGFLKRIHGGAVLTAGSTFDTPASLRRTQQLAEKQRIADLASRFLAPSATYFFDSSSTGHKTHHVSGCQGSDERCCDSGKYEEHRASVYSLHRRFSSLTMG